MVRGESGITFNNGHDLPISNVQIPRCINEYFPLPNQKHLSSIQIIPLKSPFSLREHNRTRKAPLELC
jgi:hypothetical protein